MALRALITATLSLLFVSFAFGQTNVPVSAPVQAGISKDYQLGPGDVISVKVLGEKDFDFTTEVGADGRIAVPYSNVSIPAGCRTQDAITGDVLTYLKRYIKEPLVNLQIAARNSRPPVTVVGEIRTPHEIVLTRRTWLTNVLALSQGATDQAAGIVQIFRTTQPICRDDLSASNWTTESSSEGGVTYRLFSLDKLQKGGEANNPEILPGDVVYVWKALPVYVTGMVHEPKILAFTERGMTLQDAIAQVGGLSTEAQKKDIKVSRVKDLESTDKVREEISLNLVKDPAKKNFKLQPYDMVIVDQAKDSMAMTLLKFAIGVGKTAAMAAGTGSGYRIYN